MEKSKNEILTDSIEELSKNNFDSSLIVDNKLPFVIGEQLYRVRMPNQGEQSLTEHQRNLMQLQYLSTEGAITKSQLIAKLKESGVVDIEEMDKNREVLTKELKSFWFMLATKDSGNKTKITELTQKILEIQSALQKISIDLATYLSPCLESRLDKFYVEFITYLCTEKKIGEEWKRVWNSFEEFETGDSSITNKATASMTWVLLNRR